MKKLPIILTAAFFLFILLIVILADQGRLPGQITALYDFPYGDKVGHFLLMGGLSLLVNLSFSSRPIHRHILATLLVAALVALEEASQAWFGTRHSDLGDLAASLAGIVCLGGLGWWIRTALRR
jgi:VanZ family protein